MTANGVSIIAILVVYVFADTVATANARHSYSKEPIGAEPRRDTTRDRTSSVNQAPSAERGSSPNPSIGQRSAGPSKFSLRNRAI